MNIERLLINNVKEPIGFMMDEVYLSFIPSIKFDSLTIRVFVDDQLIFTTYNPQDFTKIKLDIELTPRTRYDVLVEGYFSFHKITKSTYFITGKLNERLFGNWIVSKSKDNPLFNKIIKIDKDIKKAYLHVTTLGNFEAFINKKRISEERLTPYLSEYRTEVQLITFDVKDYLKNGLNELEIGVTPGWYMGHYGGPDSKELFGNEMAMYLEFHIDYMDGSKDLIVSDESFKSKFNRIIFSDIYDGEEITQEERDVSYPVQNKEKNVRIINRVSLPVLVKEYLEPKEYIISPKNEVIIDFGQNHSGYVEFDIEGFVGDIVIDHGEILQNDCFYNDNYRSAKARLIFHSLGKKEHVYAHYTFYGYRYIRIQGDIDVKKCHFKSAVIYSDIEQTGFFKCDNELLNRLFLNSVWGLKSNFIDVPTDCPQRDERLGWTGDAQVFSYTASLHMNSLAFYEKFLRDLRVYQENLNGGVPSCIPEIFGSHDFTAVWSDAACIIPMNLYKIYKDIDTIKKFYPLMKSWVDYVDSLIRKNNKDNMLWNFGFQYGDWLALDGESEISTFGGTDTSYIASIYFYNSLNLLVEASNLLNIDSNYYQELAKEVKKDIINTYFEGEKLKIKTQTAHIISLYYHVYVNKEEVINSLKEIFKQDNYYLKTGFVGTPLLLITLADNGMEDISLKLLFNEEFPSWLYAVKLGATTIWERWNSVLPNGLISDTGMNSLNHYSYGSVTRYFYEYLAGMKNIDDGFRKVIFKPIYTDKIKHLECEYDSVIGKFKVKYDFISQSIVHLVINIPYMAEGKLILPNGEERTINNQLLDIVYKI